MAESDQPKDPGADGTVNPHAKKPVPRVDSHTREGEGSSLVRPDEYEDLGPVPELFGAAGAEARAYASDDPLLIQDAIDRGAQPEGVEAAQIIGLIVASVVSLAVVVLLVVVLVSRLGQAWDAERQSQLDYPELTEVRLADRQILSSYGAVAGQEGVFHIPIERAQELMAAEARQAAPADDAVRQPTSRVGYNLAFPRRGVAGVAAPWTLVERDEQPAETEEMEAETQEPGIDESVQDVVAGDDEQSAAEPPQDD